MSHRRSITIAAAVIASLVAVPAASAVDYPPPAYPKGGTGQAQGPVQDPEGLQGQEVVLPDDPVGRQQGQAR